MNIEPGLDDSHEYALLVNQLPNRKSSPSLKLEQLAAAVAYRDAANDLVARLLDECAKQIGPRFSAGFHTSWESIADAMGTSKQNASQSHKRWVSRQK